MRCSWDRIAEIARIQINEPEPGVDLLRSLVEAVIVEDPP